MRLKLGCAAMIACVAVLSGCAAPARIEQMTATPSTATLASNTAWKNQIAVKEVTGGSETNPMWTSQIASADFERALEKSLAAAGMLAARQAGQYYVTADLTKLEQPLLGLDMTVTAHVKYMLVDRSSGKTIFDKTIAIPFTATVSDAFIGTERLKMANEGAARENIRKFIDELVSLKISSVAVR